MTFRWAPIAIYLLAIGFLGFYLPARIGFDFLDPVIIAGYAALSPVFAAAHLGETRRDVWWSTLFGWLSILIALAAALAVINIRYRFGALLLPSAPVLLTAIPFSLAASYLSAVVGARLLAQGWRPAVAKAAIRRVVLLTMLLLLLAARFLPLWNRSVGRLLTNEAIAYLLAGGCVLFAAIAVLLHRPKA